MSLQQFLELQNFVEFVSEEEPEGGGPNFFFPLPGAGKWVRAPICIPNWGVVPPQYRKALRAFFDNEISEASKRGVSDMGVFRGLLAASPDPWQDYDPELWGHGLSELWNREMEAQRKAWDQRASDAGLSHAWGVAKGLMKGGGCLDPEVLLQAALSSGPGPAQLIAFLQILNEVLETWINHANQMVGPTPSPPWTHTVCPTVRWDSNRVWGEWRQACANSDWVALNQVAERVGQWACECDPPASFHREAWREVQRHLVEYAAPQLKKALSGMDHHGRHDFFKKFPSLDF